MATKAPIERPDDRPADRRVRGHRAGPQLQVGDAEDRGHRADVEHAAGLVLRPDGGGRRCDAGGGRADLAVPEGRRHLGRYDSRRLGLRHHQLRVVDRYRPRRHADLGDSAAVQADVAQLDQPLRRGDDDLRRGLRRHVPADPRGPSVGELLAVPVSEHDERVAAVPHRRWRGTSSRFRRTRRSRWCSGTSA